MFDELEYEIWDEHFGYIYTTMLRCMGLTKSGRRCDRYLDCTKLFCHIHCRQSARLERECRQFFGIKAKMEGKQNG